MSFLQRAATIAVATFALAGLGSQSRAAQAAEFVWMTQAAPAVDLSMPRVPDTVPKSDILPIADADVAAGDVVAFPSLAAAVAAQATHGDSDERLRCLATSVYYESKGEPLAGQLAVAQVILNRAAAGRFGNSVCAVVKQPGQFSFVRGGRIPAVDTARPAYRIAMAVAMVALADAWDSSASKALYFHARRVSPGWKRTRVASIGNHVFYR